MRTRRRQSKAVTIAYATIAAIVLLVIAAVALVIVPPSPPSVSEFAPQAVEQIEDAPDQQSSQFGSGVGACATGQICEGPDAVVGLPPPRNVIEKARVRRCIGDPPRQTEDPQSPPCVNYWEGDNGGATSKGVTRDEIRVAFMGWFDLIEPRLVEFFNRRFEFYGRKIRLIEVPHVGGLNARNPEEKRSAAARVDEEIKAFASHASSESRLNPYFEELARRRILGIRGEQSYATERANYGPATPYLWSFPPVLDDFQANQAEWICKTLAHKNANFAGPQLAQSTRKFGVILENSEEIGEVPDISALVSGLKRCGVDIAETVEVSGPPRDEKNPRIVAAVARLSSSNVTSVTCFCDANYFFSAMRASSLRNYHPEWLIGFGSEHDVENTYTQHAPPDQNIFGLRIFNKVNSLADSPWYWAMNEIDPTYVPPDRRVNDHEILDNRNQYQALLLLASGIQLAGPELTPQTFSQALTKARFPNPGCGAPPYFQSCVGFGPSDHTMTNDVGAVWWNPAGEKVHMERGAPPGSFCYVGRGVRYSRGRWPIEPLPFFDRDQPCR